MATPSKSSTQEALRKMIAGIEANLIGGAPITVAGRSYKPAELVKVFQALIDAMDAVTHFEGELASARATSAKTAKRTLPVRRALEEYLRGIHGGTSQKLGDYGFVPDTPRKLTVKTKAEAVAKAKATRIARHTMGPRARLKVKGTLSEDAKAKANGGQGAE